VFPPPPANGESEQIIMVIVTEEMLGPFGHTATRNGNGPRRGNR
jgi:hypothetical protein